MACLTCQRNGRHCDGQRPTCRTCIGFGEGFCSWSAQQADQAANGDREEGWNFLDDGPAIERIRVALVPRDPLYREFFSHDWSVQLLRFDHGLRHLLQLSVTMQMSEQQGEAQLGVIALLVQGPGVSGLVSSAHYEAAAAAVAARLTEHGEQIYASENITVSMALLAYYERYRFDDRSFNRSHISSYQATFSSSSTPFNYFSRPHRTTLEIFIYHTARETLFSLRDMSNNLSYSYVDDVIARCLIPPASQHMEGLSGYLTIFGLSMLTLSTVYKISYLRHKVPLADGHLEQAHLIGHSLGSSIYRRRQGVSLPHVAEATGLDGIRPLNELYLCACQILLAKIMNPSISRSAPNIQRELERAIQLVQSLQYSRHYEAAVWPLTILALAAPYQLQAFRLALQHFRNHHVARSSFPALAFLEAIAGMEAQGLIGSGFDVLAQPQIHLPRVKY